MQEETKFAPPQKSSEQVIRQENKIVSTLENFREVFNSVSSLAAVVNDKRQVVFANQELIDLLGVDSIEALLGKRPGEAIGCIHSHETPAGCGTAESCSVCGAVNSILECQRTGKRASRETRISAVIGGRPVQWDFWVTAIPLLIGDKIFSVITFSDISGEKWAACLEKLFFHDVLNSAGSLRGIIKALKDTSAHSRPSEHKELIELSERASEDLLDDIVSYREIKLAESGDLQVIKAELDSLSVLNDCVARIRHHDIVADRMIEIDPGSCSVRVETDRALLSRILQNMLKNALEATEKGGTVRAGVSFSGGRACFRVNNASEMPADVKLQVFQRSFSTKGGNRGLGTFSIKLIGERYLGATVRFESAASSGTTFYLELDAKEVA